MGKSILTDSLGIDKQATAERINMYMHARNMNTVDITKMFSQNVGIWITEQAVSGWRTGKYLPDVQNMYTLSRIFCCRVDDLLVPYIRHAAGNTILRLWRYNKVFQTGNIQPQQKVSANLPRMDAEATGKHIVKCISQSGMDPEVVRKMLGVSKQAVSKWKTGRSLPAIEKMYILSRMIGITVDELLVPYGETESAA